MAKEETLPWARWTKKLHSTICIVLLSEFVSRNAWLQQFHKVPSTQFYLIVHFHMFQVVEVFPAFSFKSVSYKTSMLRGARQVISIGELARYGTVGSGGDCSKVGIIFLI